MELEQEQNKNEVLLVSEEPAALPVDASPEGLGAPSEYQQADGQDISGLGIEGVPGLEIDCPSSVIEIVDVESKGNEDEVIVVEDHAGMAEDSQLHAVPDEVDLLPGSTGDMDPGGSDGTQNEEHGDERRVSFAPGTPEPKPTPRKKKTPRGTKGKKKRIAVPLDEVPPDILAMIDGSFGDPPPPVPEVPQESDAQAETGGSQLPELEVGRIIDDPLPEKGTTSSFSSPEGAETEPSTGDKMDVPVLDERLVVDDQPPAEPGHSEIVEEKPIPLESTEPDDEQQEPLESDSDGGDAKVADLPKEESLAVVLEPAPSTDEAALERPSKKKGSKSSKDKSKKKSAKSKSEDSSPPLSGLGIDVSPPSIPENDDSLKDSPPLDEEVSVLPGNQPIDTKVQHETSKEAESEDRSPVASSEPEPDTLVESKDESGSESQPGTTLNVDGGEDKSTESVLDDDLAAKDCSSSLETDTGPLAVVQDQIDGNDESKTDSAPSPTDSGVEFEDVQKDVANEEDSKSVSGDEVEEDCIESPCIEKELQNSSGMPSPTPDEAEKTSSDTVDINEDEVKLEETASETILPVLEDEALPERTLLPPSLPEEKPENGGDEGGGEGISNVAELQSSQQSESNDLEEREVETKTVDLDLDLPEPEPTSEPLSSEEPEAVSEKIEPEIFPSETAADEIAPEESLLGTTSQEIEPKMPEPEAIGEGVVLDVPKSIDDPVIDEVGVEASSADEEVGPAEEEPAPEGPPSPNLSKTSSNGSRKHKADHWERKHADNVLKGAFEDNTIVLQKSKKGGKEEVRVKDRTRKSRRLSSTEEDDAWRRRRALRKEEDARRLMEEEQRKLAEDKARRIRRDDRRSARKAEAEVEEKIKRLRAEEEHLLKQKDEEARRRRHRDRDRDRGSEPSQKEVKHTGAALKLPSLTLPKALGLANGQSYHGRPVRYTEEPPVASASRPKENEAALHESRKDASKEETARPSSSNGGKSQHRHRHHQRPEGDRSSRCHKDSDHRPRRHVEVEEERSKTLFGMLRRR